MTLNLEKIRRLREQRQMTMEEAAVAAGMRNRHRWYEVESGDRKDPRIFTVARVAKALGVRVDDLLA